MFIKTQHRWGPRTAVTPFYAEWVINAPWAHPAWQNYIILLYDLTTKLDTPPELHMDNPTHEVIVFALNPDHPIPEEIDWVTWKTARLEPANHAYQFITYSDEAALTQIANIVQMIETQQLSPDTDHRPLWDNLFQDGATLHKG